MEPPVAADAAVGEAARREMGISEAAFVLSVASMELTTDDTQIARRRRGAIRIFAESHGLEPTLLVADSACPKH